MLLYPHSEAINRNDICYASEDNVKVDISFVDLRNPDESINKLLAEIF